MGNTYCSAGCNDGCQPSIDESEPEFEESSEKSIAPVESYNKLVTWLIQMSETDEDSESSEKSKKKAIERNCQNFRSLLDRNSGSFESHCSSEIPHWGSMFRSSASDEIPEEDLSDFQSKQSSFDVVDSQDRTLQVPKRGVLVKQDSVCDSQYSESEFSEKRYELPRIQCEQSDSFCMDAKTKELNLLRARLHDMQHRRSRQRHELMKQKSESCVERIYRHDHTFLKRQKKAARSCDNINNRPVVTQNIPSIQMQASSDDDIITFSATESDQQKDPEMIPLHDYTTKRDADDNIEMGLLNNRRNNFRGKVSEFWSKSVGSLMGRSTRAKSYQQRKSNSLFTVQPNTSFDSTMMKENLKRNYSERVLDDKLLDGNIADILFAVDAIWPKT